jgi:hypothetical protein
VTVAPTIAPFVSNLSTLPTNLVTFTTNRATYSVILPTLLTNASKILNRPRKFFLKATHFSVQITHLTARSLKPNWNENTRTLREYLPMARSQRTSRILEKAQLRAMKLKAIDAEMDFGRDRNMTTFTTKIEKLQAKLNHYNNLIELLDAAKNEIDESERELGDLSDEMLNGVSTRYGNDSREYEMAGGTRKSDRIRKSAESRVKNSAMKKLVNAVNN